MLRVVLTNRQRTLRFSAAGLRKAARVAAGNHWKSGEVSVVVVGGAEMARLNVRHTGRTGQTDVLAFNLEDEGDASGIRGEIIANASRAMEEAGRRGIRSAHELTLYIVHGILHLTGYDDHSAKDRRRMYTREARVLAELRIPDIRPFQPGHAVRRPSRRGTAHA